MSRVEIFLNALLNGSKDVPRPQSRIEACLYALIQKGGAGGVSSWNDLPDRPFYAETELLTYGGDMAGKETAQIGDGAYLVKMSDYFSASAADYVGKTIAYNLNSTKAEYTFTENDVVDTSSEGMPMIMCLNAASMTLVSVVYQDFSLDGINISTGTYFVHMESEGESMYPTSFAMELVHKLDSKYLPDDLSGSGGAFYVTVSSEDGSTYTADKTVAELEVAYQEGKQLVCIDPNGIHLPMAERSDGPAYTFSGMFYASTIQVAICGIYSEGVIYQAGQLLTVLGIPTSLPNPNPVVFKNAYYAKDSDNRNYRDYGDVEYTGDGKVFIKGLPNTYALTVNGTTYDGSAEVDLTDVINAMIDAKLGGA